MFKILIDTCVWLDIAKDPRQRHLLDVLHQCIEERKISLIVPRIIVNELNRNKSRIIEQSKQSITSLFRTVREHVDKLGNKKYKKLVLDELNDVNQKLPTLADTATHSIATIEDLFSRSNIIETSDSILIRAAQRAIQQKAPFHREKNSMNDAIIMETFAECVGSKDSIGNRFAFVTHNVKDFSEPNGNQKLPHPDFASSFTRRKSLYFINLAELLRRLQPEMVSEFMISRELLEQTRSSTEIQEAERELEDKIWYNRHQYRKARLETGKDKIINRDQYTYEAAQNTVVREIWLGAQKSAKRIEKRYGLQNLGPWDDFEWGMLNGKLSALRWIGGDDWDSLYT